MQLAVDITTLRTAYQFYLFRNFIKRFILTLKPAVSVTGSRLVIMYYGYAVQWVYDTATLQYPAIATAIGAVDMLIQPTASNLRSGNLTALLDSVLQQNTTVSGSSRGTSEHQSLVIMCGQSTGLGQADVQLATALKNESVGISTLAIGVSSQEFSSTATTTGEARLSIVSEPASTHTYYISDAEEVVGMAEIVSEQAQQGIVHSNSFFLCPFTGKLVRSLPCTLSHSVPYSTPTGMPVHQFTYRYCRILLCLRRGANVVKCIDALIFLPYLVVQFSVEIDFWAESNGTSIYEPYNGGQTLQAIIYSLLLALSLSDVKSTSWSEWSSCSVTCGQGNEWRQLRCRQSGTFVPCSDTSPETRACKSGVKCPAPKEGEMQLTTVNI